MIITFFTILTMLFLLFRLGLPDPMIIYIREGLGPEERAILMRRFGLDKPLHEQYFLYVVNFLTGEMGISFYYKSSVFPIVIEKFLNTLILMLPALVTAYTLGGPIGAFLAWRRGRKFEKVTTILAVINYSAPLFWISLIAIFIFAIWLRWVPAGGMRTMPYEAANFFEKVMNLDFVHHFILPFSVLSLSYLAIPMLLMRNTMLEVLGSDFIELARAKGLNERVILYRHAARNAMLPLITQFAISTGLIVGGAVAVEVVFSWPGLGREISTALKYLDYPLIQGTFMFMALMIMILNFIVDVLYSYLDPRISYE